MPASETRQGQQHDRLLTVAFWAGVGLAPIAALLVLFSSGSGALRFGAVLVIVAVVLIGLAMKLRPDPGAMRTELEDSLLAEIDALRDDVREDIATAARATHKAFVDRSANLQEQVEALRAQVERARVAMERAATARPAPAPAAPLPPQAAEPRGMVGRGVVQHTETVQVTTRQTIVDQHDDRGTVYGSQAQAAGRDAPRDRDEARGADRRDPRDADRPDSGRGRAEREADRSDSGRGRSDRDADRSDSGRRRAERDPDRQRDSWATAPREESWTDQKLRERFGDLSRAAAGLRGGTEPEDREDRRESDRSSDDWLSTDRPGGSRRGGRPEFADPDGDEPRRGAVRDGDDPADSPAWSGLRAGDRWASVRTDDRGRELRMGERRASVHNDESGSEIRIEDRWAAVRRDEGLHGSRDEGLAGESRSERRAREERRAEPAAREEFWSPPATPAALPAAPAEPVPTWTTAWSEEIPRERVRDSGPRDVRRSETSRDRDAPESVWEPAERGRSKPRDPVSGDLASRDAAHQEPGRVGAGREPRIDVGSRGRSHREPELDLDAPGYPIRASDRGSGPGRAEWSDPDDRTGRPATGPRSARPDQDSRGTHADEAGPRSVGEPHRSGAAGRGRRWDADSRADRWDADGRDDDGRDSRRRDADDRDDPPGRTRASGRSRDEERDAGRSRSGDRGTADRDDQWERSERPRSGVPRQRRVDIDSSDDRWA